MNAMFTNPGLLKLDLAIRGARLAPEIASNVEIFRVPTLLDHAGRTLEVILPEDVSVNVPVGEAFTQDSPYTLAANGDGFVVSTAGHQTSVRIVPQPRFYGLETRSGASMWRVGTAYGGYLAINPATGCDFTQNGLACRFCDVPTRVGERDAALSVADVVETVRAAFAEAAIEYVYLHIGYMHGEDAGILFLEPYVRAIKRHFDTLVAVQLQPPRLNAWIDRTYAIGVDALSYSVEIHDAELLHRHCPGRAQQVGRERYYEALRHAATVFPSGTVWSDLIVGLEPAESTIAGIDTLVEMGVLPVLSLFRPLDDTELSDHPLPSPSDVVPVFAHLFQAVRRSRINMHWVRDLSFAVTPIEARFFVGDDARTNPGLSQFYRSRLGTIAARNLSRLRRRLRVKQVSDSFDSSHL
jgi:hypothetical protein